MLVCISYTRKFTRSLCYCSHLLASCANSPLQSHEGTTQAITAGAEEGKAIKLLKPGGTLAHILNSGSDKTRMEQAKKWTDKK